MSIISALATLLVLCSGLWLFALFLCTFSFVQRQVFYAHNAPISRGQQLSKPETFGYLKHQAIEHSIITSDGVSLYAWLIVPLKAYLKHEREYQTASSAEDAKALALDSIAKDSLAKVVIYFHGNAGTVGQTRRTEAYRSITNADSEHIYVLAYDYRGFGRSTGTPTEAGLIQDALAVTEWVMRVAKVPAKHIVFLAQSLGTAIASAAVNHYACRQTPIEFGGLILCAPFVDTAQVFMSYSISGGIPILGLLQYLPWLRRHFVKRITDTWKTKERLQSILMKTTSLRLTLVHATSDKVIPYRMTRLLSDMISDSLSDYGIDYKQKVDTGEGGCTIEWRSGDRVVRKVILRHGGHNTIMKWAPVSSEVAKILMV